MEEPAPLPARRPGDLILDRILPDADADTRDQARESLRRYGVALLRLGERIDESKKFEVAYGVGEDHGKPWKASA